MSFVILGRHCLYAIFEITPSMSLFLNSDVVTIVESTVAKVNDRFQF